MGSQVSREYPSRPLIGVGAIISDNGRIVLVRRGSPPGMGEWSIPGGLVKVGETLNHAVVREALEETGLEVGVRGLVELLERIFSDSQGRVRYHYVIADYLCEVRGGRLAPGSDASDARWVDEADLENLGVADVAIRVIRKAVACNRKEP